MVTRFLLERISEIDKGLMMIIGGDNIVAYLGWVIFGSINTITS